MPYPKALIQKSIRLKPKKNGAEPRLTRNMKRRPPVIPNGSGMTPPKE